MSQVATPPMFSSVWRQYVVLGVFAALALAVTGRLFYLQVESQSFLQSQGDNFVIRKEKLPGHRGIITDRNGEPLAVSTPVTTLAADPRQLITMPDKWAALARALEIPEADFIADLKKRSDRSFMYLRRRMNPARAEAILQARIPGIWAEEEYRRYYPAGEVTSHLVGFTDIDEQGKEGVELSFQQVLEGAPGFMKVVRDRTGRVLEQRGLMNEAQQGQDLALSIDLRAQYLAYRELLSAVTEYKAHSGSAVAINVKTGEVLAMVNQPSYNPNNRTAADLPNFRNRALTDVFEPGSTVKPFTVAAALQSGRWQPYSTVDTAPGFLRVGSKTIRDMANYREIDLGKIIVKSSNVGATKLALSMEPQQLSQFFRSVGLGQATGVGFPGEQNGYLPAREMWRPIEIATLSYGYGLSVTTLQLAQAYAVLGAGGVKRPVSLLKVDEPVTGERVMSEHVARQVLSMMEGVVNDEGTAKKARVPGYKVAGKTGTVHKATNGGYADHRYMALFAGVAPADDPEIALVVVIDDPQGDAYYGGQVAAPVFSRVMAGLLRVRNVAPDKPLENYAANLEQAIPRT